VLFFITLLGDAAECSDRPTMDVGPYPVDTLILRRCEHPGLTFAAQQRTACTGDARLGADCSRDGEIERGASPKGVRRRLDATPVDPGIPESELPDAPLQKAALLPRRFHEIEASARPQDSKRNARKAAAAAHVEDAHGEIRGYGKQHCETREDMGLERGLHAGP
jgi:hypothetical protein